MSEVTITIRPENGSSVFIEDPSPAQIAFISGLGADSKFHIDGRRLRVDSVHSQLDSTSGNLFIEVAGFYS